MSHVPEGEMLPLLLAGVTLGAICEGEAPAEGRPQARSMVSDSMQPPPALAWLTRLWFGVCYSNQPWILSTLPQALVLPPYSTMEARRAVGLRP